MGKKMAQGGFRTIPRHLTYCRIISLLVSPTPRSPQARQSLFSELLSDGNARLALNIVDILANMMHMTKRQLKYAAGVLIVVLAIALPLLAVQPFSDGISKEDAISIARDFAQQNGLQQEASVRAVSETTAPRLSTIFNAKRALRLIPREE